MSSIEIETIIEARRKAYRDALRALAKYKYHLFGQYAGDWVKYNALLPRKFKQRAPFNNLVFEAQKMEERARTHDPG